MGLIGMANLQCVTAHVEAMMLASLTFLASLNMLAEKAAKRIILPISLIHGIDASIASMTIRMN
jgi:hypothetical protein